MILRINKSNQVNRCLLSFVLPFYVAEDLISDAEVNITIFKQPRSNVKLFRFFGRKPTIATFPII